MTPKKYSVLKGLIFLSSRAPRNARKFKCKVLRLGWGNPKRKYRLSGNWIKNSLEEKDLVVVVLMRSSI